MAESETRPPPSSLQGDRVRGDDDKAADRLDPNAAGAREDKRRKDQLLDEGVEETFPASDPVSVKHIT